MKKRYLLTGLLVLILVAALVAAGCESGTTTTTATPGTTATSSTQSTTAPSTESTTTASSTETTTAGPATGEPIKIGFSNSLTGPFAAAGDSMSKGVALQVEYYNSIGGIGGRPLDVIELDDKSDVPMAIANVNKLIQQDKVFATIGPFAQYMQEAARQIAEDTKVPMIGGGPATLEQLAGTQYQWSVMMSAAPPTQADALEKIIASNGWKTILGIGDVLTINQETLALVEKDGAAKGYAMTKMPDAVDFTVTDYQPILNRMMEQISKTKPEAILLYVSGDMATPMYKGLRALGVTIPILGPPAAAHPSIFAMGPEAVEGFLVLDSGGIVNPTALPGDWPLKTVQMDFFARYQAKYGQAPDFFAAYGADYINVLVAAMTQAGAVDRDKLQQALINLKGLVTLEGIQNFSPDATSQGVTGQMVEFVAKNGQFELVAPVN